MNWAYPFLSLTVDTLHCVHLVLTSTFCAIGPWQLLDSRAYGYMGTAEEHLQVSVLGLRRALNTWYKKRAQLYPNEKLTRLNDLTVQMLGNPGRTKVQKERC